MSKILTQKTLWAILAGLAYVFCFPRYDMPWFSIFFLPCLLFSLYSLKTIKEAWVLGALLSCMVAWGGFHWIIYLAQNFGNLPLPLAIGLLLLYCLVAAPAMVAFYVIGFKFRTKIETIPLFLRSLFWAALFVALEYIFHFLKIFPEHLGNTLIYFLPLAQAASIGGVGILSFFPLFFGANLFYSRKYGKKNLPGLITSILLIFGFWLWGKVEIQKLQALPHNSLQVGIVQPNMEEIEKMSAKMGSRAAIEKTIGAALEKTYSLYKANPMVDLIVWPETTYPLVFPTKQSSSKSWAADGYANLVKSAIAEIKVPLLFGGYESENNRDYNSAILLDKSGNAVESYKKVVLLIVGEYLPFTDMFPSLKELNPMMGDFGRGPGAVPISFSSNHGKLLLGVNICYEAILPEFMRGFALNGTDLFLNLTKDSWFGDTFEPWQHFQLAQLRSIEHRIPTLRVTNTGLSGLVSTWGESKIVTAPFQEFSSTIEVPLNKSPTKTLYTLLGDWFAWVCLLFTSFLLIRLYRK